MDGQLLLVLLLLLGASSLWGQEPGPGGPLEEPLEEEVLEEDGILVLSQRTLGLALQEHPALLVEFCECSGPVGLGDPQGPPWRVLPPIVATEAPVPLCPWGFIGGHQGRALGVQSSHCGGHGYRGDLRSYFCQLFL